MSDRRAVMEAGIGSEEHAMLQEEAQETSSEESERARDSNWEPPSDMESDLDAAGPAATWKHHASNRVMGKMLEAIEQNPFLEGGLVCVMDVE